MKVFARLTMIATLLGATMSTGAQDPKSAAEVRELVELLAAVDAAVPAAVSAAFAPGASDEALEQLSRTILKGQPLPEDLAALLKWHNGQEWNAELSPNNNRRLLTPGDHRRMVVFQRPSTDYLEPRLASWVPLYQ
jgi:hypothetical protein